MPYNDEEEAFPYATIGTDDAKRMIEAGAHVIEESRRRGEAVRLGDLRDREVVDRPHPLVGGRRDGRDHEEGDEQGQGASHARPFWCAPVLFPFRRARCRSKHCA